jgi:hypothetical protein
MSDESKAIFIPDGELFEHRQLLVALCEGARLLQTLTYSIAGLPMMTCLVAQRITIAAEPRRRWCVVGIPGGNMVSSQGTVCPVYWAGCRTGYG